jgi:hypothetical protein
VRVLLHFNKFWVLVCSSLRVALWGKFKTVSVHMKGTFVGVSKEHFNSINVDVMSNVLLMCR